jgi:hypothetical protein
MAGLALLAQWEFEGVDRPDALKSAPAELKGCLDYILSQPEQKKALRGPDVWGNIWAIEFLLGCHDKDAFRGEQQKIKSKLQACIDALIQMQGPDGGLYYYDKNASKSNSFVGAPAILGLLRAKREGFNVPETGFQKLVSHLKACKQQDGIFMYKTGVRQSAQGSCARGAACELALQLAGQGSVQAVQLAVENFFKNRHILEVLKGKTGTHMGDGGTAPYYFLYSHYYTSRAIKVLDKGAQTAHLTKLRDLMLGCQEDDGSWSDWPRTKGHKVYGAAFGALTLYHIATLGSDADAAGGRGAPRR